MVSAKDAVVREKRGEEVTRTDATILKTTLRHNAGGVDFFVKESVEDLLDRFDADVSEDTGGEEYDDDGNLVVAEEPKPAKPRRRRAA